MKDFIVNFADQFDDLDASTISAETNFRELDGWSSMVALSVMAMVDDEYEYSLGLTKCARPTLSRNSLN